MRARELFDFGACATAWRTASSCVNSSSFLGLITLRAKFGPERGPPKRKPAFASAQSASHLFSDPQKKWLARLETTTAGSSLTGKQGICAPLEQK